MMLSQMAVNQNLSFPIGLGNIGSRSSWVSKSLDQNGCQVNLAARATMTLRIGAGSGLEFMWGQLGFLHAWRVSRPAFECIPHHPEHGMLRHVNCAFCYGCSPSFCSFWKSVQQLRPARSPSISLRRQWLKVHTLCRASLRPVTECFSKVKLGIPPIWCLIQK